MSAQALKQAWCPDYLRPNNLKLRNMGYRAPDRRRIILELHERNIAKGNIT